MEKVRIKILVDTDVLINFLRGKNEVRELLTQANIDGDLYCSVINVAEIYSGMRLKEKEETENLLAGITIIPVDENIARKAGYLRSSIKNNKQLLADCLIAASAILNNCTLLTFNVRDFPFQEIHFYDPS